MNTKKNIFSPGQGGGLTEPEDDLYTGQPDLSGMDFEQPETPSTERNRSRNKGHAAYAAHDDLPPAPPRGRGVGSLGGLFAGESPEAADRNAGEQAVSSEDMLAALSLDVLSAECQKRVCPACQVKKEADDARLRALADLDNAKKRLAREREEQVRFAAESVLTDIIPSLDNLDLALQHAGNDQACANLVVGVRMTRKLLQEALTKNGLRTVGDMGEEFDPAIHEAVGVVNSPDTPDGHVCSLLAYGYMLNDRLLRPARVMVCRKEG
jgi:molecular chaperone GrpE